MIPEALFWIDGVQGDSVPLPDRGLDFGDGLFETLLYIDGAVLYREYHFARLARGLAQLGFPECERRVQNDLDRVLSQLATTAHGVAGALRISVTRGSSTRGYAPAKDSHPRTIIAFTPLPADPRLSSPPGIVGISSVRWADQSLLAGIKHLNRLEQVMAGRERLALEFDEMLMLDSQERVVSVISGNIFLGLDGKLLTPILDTVGVRGTRRQLLMDRWVQRLGMVVEERDIFLADVYKANEVFFSNSLIGVRAIAAVDDRRWHAHPLCDALFDIYWADIA